MATAPTQELLAMAYRHLARPGWPATLADALAHRSYGTAVRGLARNFGRRSKGAAASNTGAQPASATHHPTRRTATTAGKFDAKKAAANDMDDVTT